MPENFNIMNVHSTGDLVRVTGVQQLHGPEVAEFRDRVLSSLSPRSKGSQQVEVDLSQIITVDGGGLGALLSVHQACGGLRLLNPPPAVRQLLDLTRMTRVFQIVQN